jgi:hypothetical protein
MRNKLTTAISPSDDPAAIEQGDLPMTDIEVVDAYESALREYEAVKLRHGDRTLAFVKVLAAERTVVARLGQECHSIRSRGLN